MTQNYTIDQITEMVQELTAAGYRYDWWTLSKGWWIKAGDPRFGIRLGDPKPFNMAVIAAYNYRQYVS